MVNSFTFSAPRWVMRSAALLVGSSMLLASCTADMLDNVAAPADGADGGVANTKQAAAQEASYQALIAGWQSIVKTGKAGGSLTTNDFTAAAFEQPAPGLTGELLATHQAGRIGFDKEFPFHAVAPLFIDQSCAGCHVGGGRSKILPSGSPQLLYRVSQPGTASDGGSIGVPGFGLQLQIFAVGKDSTRITSPEGRVSISYAEQLRTLADGSTVSLRKPTYSFSVPLPAGTMFSPRIGSQVAGLGLLEAVPEATILAIANNQASLTSLGISGRPNYVWDPVTNTTKLGRFGWKANQSNLVSQNAGAYNGDMGITTSLFPLEPDGSATVGGGVDLNDKDRNDVDVFTRTLGVPAFRTPNDPQVAAGRALFMKAKCALCHIPVLQTGALRGFPLLSNQTIMPFTDLLLHDMGPGLADNRPDYRATGSEWRTPPLWGLGLTQTTSGHTFLLHDGRARNVTEAIMWHDGEGASSRKEFEKMNANQRQHLLAFLNSL